MLGELRIANFAIIEDLTLGLESGLNVITGETGSGKSILIDALGLLLGTRASTEAIRAGCSQAAVEGRFEGPFDPRLKEQLDAWGIAFDGESLPLRRQITAAGKSRAWIGPSAVTVGQLAELAPLLVDICGQHEYQTLMAPDRQRAFIDQYGGLEPLRVEVGTRWERYRQAVAESKRLETLEAHRAEREAFLRFQWKELKDIEVSREEEAALADLRRRLTHVDRLATGTEGIEAGLGEGRESVAARLDGWLRSLEDMVQLDPALTEPLDLLRQARATLHEAAWRLGRYRSGLSADPVELERVEGRWAEYKALSRKYGGSPAEVMARKEAVREELAAMEDTALHRARAEKSLRSAESDYLASAQQLGRERREAARRLEEAVMRQLDELAMKATRFHIGFQEGPVGPDRYGAEGIDAVEFRIAPNVGEELKPLHRIASGGELSRILLAMRRAAAERERVPRTYVFDEVDTGIGGEVAESIGRKMAEIGRRDQVLCVTHLPQLAVWATRQIRLWKEVESGRTLTRGEALEAEGRVEEIARMLAGARITGATREHAREMLNVRRARRKAV